MKLHRLWVRWRRRRYGSLVSHGMPSHLAWGIARAETPARQRLARLIGRKVAEAATLQVREDEGGTFKFALANGPETAWGEVVA